MPEQFQRIAEYARRGSALEGAASLRARGTRRLRRRRAGQAVLGTGALAVVTGFGVNLATAAPAPTHVGPAAATSSPTAVPTPTVVRSTPSPVPTNTSPTVMSTPTPSASNVFTTPTASAPDKAGTPTPTSTSGFATPTAARAPTVDASSSPTATASK